MKFHIASASVYTRRNKSKWSHTVSGIIRGRYIKIQITQDVLLTASGEVSLRFIDELLVTVFRSKSSFTHECLHNVIKNSKTKTMGTTSLIQ
jgi:hypothetical protein